MGDGIWTTSFRKQLKEILKGLHRCLVCAGNSFIKLTTGDKLTKLPSVPSLDRLQQTAWTFCNCLSMKRLWSRVFVVLADLAGEDIASNIYIA